MQDEGSTALVLMSDMKMKAEDSVELALSQQLVLQQLFKDQLEATSQLVNATQQAYANVIWNSIVSIKWLGVVMALKPYYGYCGVFQAASMQKAC